MSTGVVSIGQFSPRKIGHPSHMIILLIDVHLIDPKLNKGQRSIGHRKQGLLDDHSVTNNYRPLNHQPEFVSLFHDVYCTSWLWICQRLVGERVDFCYPNNPRF